MRFPTWYTYVAWLLLMGFLASALLSVAAARCIVGNPVSEWGGLLILATVTLGAIFLSEGPEGGV